VVNSRITDSAFFPHPGASVINFSPGVAAEKIDRAVEIISPVSKTINFSDQNSSFKIIGLTCELTFCFSVSYKEGKMKNILELIDFLEKNLSLKNQYTLIQRPKRDGGVRIIHAPSDDLKKVQRIILTFLNKLFLENQNHFIFGLTKKSGSTVDHGNTHSRSLVTYQWDLESAFPSTSVKRVSQALLNQLTKVIQESPLYPLKPEKVCSQIKKLVDLIVLLCTHHGFLNQGPPTSPFLFYLVLRDKKIIEKIGKLVLKTNGVTLENLIEKRFWHVSMYSHPKTKCHI